MDFSALAKAMTVCHHGSNFMFGCYRLILAMLVAANHFGWVAWGLTPGGWAVVGFYVLSGLLMERQFNRLSKNGGVGSFYIDRFLRIYPLFFTSIVIYDFFTPLPGRYLLLNLCLLPLNYTPLALPSLIVPAFSLACEAHFYILVPLLVWAAPPNTIVLRFLAIGSMAFSAISPFLFFHTFWAYASLPGMLFTFLTGILINRQEHGTLKLLYVLNAVLLAWFILGKIWLHLPTGIDINVCLGYMMGVPLTCWLVKFSPRVKWDQVLGSLSFPLFLIHELVLQVCRREGIPLNILSFLACSLVASALLVVLVEKPVDYLRYKVRRAPASV